MAQFRRFGRRMPVASTLAISRDLRALWADEQARQYCTEAAGLPGDTSWEDIIDHRRTVAVAPKQFAAAAADVLRKNLN